MNLFSIHIHVVQLCVVHYAIQYMQYYIKIYTIQYVCKPRNDPRGGVNPARECDQRKYQTGMALEERLFSWNLVARRIHLRAIVLTMATWLGRCADLRPKKYLSKDLPVCRRLEDALHSINCKSDRFRALRVQRLLLSHLVVVEYISQTEAYGVALFAFMADGQPRQQLSAHHILNVTMLLPEERFAFAHWIIYIRFSALWVPYLSIFAGTDIWTRERLRSVTGQHMCIFTSEGKRKL